MVVAAENLMVLVSKVVAAAAPVVAAVALLTAVLEPADKGRLVVSMVGQKLAVLVVAALVKKVIMEVLAMLQLAWEALASRARSRVSLSIMLVVVAAEARVMLRTAVVLAVSVAAVRAVVPAHQSSMVCPALTALAAVVAAVVPKASAATAAVAWSFSATR